MVEKEKWFQPEAEEVYVGLECKWATPDDNYKGKLSPGDLGELLQNYQQDFVQRIRVRHLCPEDIEKNGWVKSDRKSEWVFGQSYFLEREIGFNTGTRFWATFDRYPGGIVLEWETYGSYQTYKGEVSLKTKGYQDFLRQLNFLKQQYG